MLKAVQGLIGGVCLLAVMITANAASWSEIENKSRRVNGFMPYYLNSNEGKVWLEVSKFEQPFIMYTGLPYGIGSNDIGLDRGQLGQTRLVQFERYGNKVFLKHLNTGYRADTENQAEKNSVNEAFASSVLHGFEIDARSGNRYLIDLTAFLQQDLHGVSVRLKATQQGNFSIDVSRSALVADKVKNFPKNTLFESVLTFKGSDAGNHVKQVVPTPGAITVHQHVSFVAPPDDNYQPRVFHPKSGFFELTYADYASAIDQQLEQKLIYRHRLERDKDGKIKPIVYYLDPGAPEPVRTALLEGARWWEQAFAAIGLEGAYEVRDLPEDADPMDVRYNVIQWVHRATRGWSYGMAMSDPRTGEIIKGHVTLGSLRVRQDLLIANALTGVYGKEGDKQAAMDMALARIRQLSAHEVGHTLGIAHNFASSPNNRASVMDYPHPLVTLEGETVDGKKVSLKNAYAEGIGKWDIEAVRYGYTEFDPELEPEQEVEALRKIVRDYSAKGLMFISDPDARPASGAHPSAHLWDNGQNSAAELARVLEVRKVALAKFGHNNLADGIPYSELAETLVPLYLFHRYQVEAAVKLVGGVNYEYSVKGDTYRPIRPVEEGLQKQAIGVLLSTLAVEQLMIPDSVLQGIPPKAYGYYKNRESFNGYTGLTLDPVSMAEASAKHTLQLLLNRERLARLLQQKAQMPELPGLEEVVSQLLTTTLRSSEQAELNGLIQQRVDYLTVMQLLTVASDKNASPEVRAHLHHEIGKLDGWLTTQSKRNSVRYAWLKDLVVQYLNGDFVPNEETQSLPIPPGSPIGS